MRKLLPLALCATLLLTLPACAIQPEEPENPYRVKSISFENYIDENTIHRSVYDYSYNETGDIVSFTTSSNGTIEDTTTYELDEYGNILRSTVERDGSEVIEDYVLTLDDQHRILFSENYQDDALIATHEYAYDKNRNQTMLNIVRMENGEPSLTSWTDMTYDKQGNLIRQDVRWSDGTTSYTLYEYSNNIPLRKESYNSYDVLTDYTTYTYDESGLVVTATTNAADGTPTFKNIKVFDEYENLLSAEYFRYNASTSTFELGEKRTCTYEPISTT